MKQLGNLAIVCAKRPGVLMQLHAGMVSVFYEHGPSRGVMSAKWDDDEKISAIIHELNFGKAAEQRKEYKAA